MFIDEERLLKSLFHGSPWRASILRNIAFYIEEKLKHNNTPTDPPINQDFLRYILCNNSKSIEVTSCLQQISDMHYSTLQKLCRNGGGQAGRVLNMTPRDWMSCFRTGRGCQDEMSAAIRESVDSRVFRCIRRAKSDLAKVIGYLSTEGDAEW